MNKYKARYDEKNEIKPAEYINILDIDAGEEAVLSKLINRFAGKAIYIDLWSTWCGPCIMEMKYYPQLIEKYQDEDLVFVFFAALSPEKFWQHRINEFGLNGHQYLLNDTQYYALEQYFELRGFPQHIIVDKTGKIIEPKGPRISTPEGNINPNLLSILDKMLEK